MAGRRPPNDGDAQRRASSPGHPSGATRTIPVAPHAPVGEGAGGAATDGGGGSAIVPEHFLFERYADRPVGRSGLALRTYYRLRPYIPRATQIAMRRAYARRQRRRSFPHWPIEPLLVEHQQEKLLRQLAAYPGDRLPLVNFWPGDHRFAFVLTHDVEGVAGVENIHRLLEVERRHGCVSSWNFCAEEYPIAEGTFEMIRSAGCEVGLHGIDHTCRLFSSRERFEQELPAIHRYLRDWDAVGFRSPAMHRNADWMPELGCLYDSSFPDTDPFEPQPGGCCSIFPFLNGDLVELPVTLVQDHTLFDILERDDIAPWRVKAEWIAAHRGLVNVIVHPDYMRTPERLARYEELIVLLRGLEGGWHALPREVAAWWKVREGLRPEPGDDGRFVVSGAGGWDASVVYASAGLHGGIDLAA